MERAIKTLKFNGFIVNSHTNNECLDQPRYCPILEPPKRSIRRCTFTRRRRPMGWLRHFATIAWRVQPGVTESRPVPTRSA